MPDSRVVIGVDLGGTNVRAQAFHSDGTPAGDLATADSRAREGVEKTIEALAKTIHSAMAKSAAPPVAVGLAIG